MTGPKLQGLAMVEHQGALYRVGGFTALNKAGDDQDLKSQAEFARFDSAKKTWESLPAMPEPRSSHDAVMLGDKLYVVGGWNLQGNGQTSKWHETALQVNLADADLKWTPIAAPPFKRRAVATAAWNGKLYCIGGMQEKGGTTTAVAVYDPAKDSWSEGPSLLGTAMDGFGASAFPAHGALYATTMSGSIQRLSQDGKQWESLGQLAHPRFFHRLLPWQDRQLVVVGGAHMSVGKIEGLELVEVK
jgi:N-acetylneuraminic acid mutarotase